MAALPERGAHLTFRPAEDPLPTPDIFQVIGN